MPDVTDQIPSETIPDPHYYPMSPSVEDILTYKQELESEGRGITIEWATSEIKNHLLNWVRVGLVADAVRRYRLYKGKFARWQDYCQSEIGKSVWQVKRIINAAKVVIELAEAGFEQLPTCEAQASKLVRYLDQSSICSNHQTLYDKWKQVISRLPKHQITGDKIDEELGHLKPARKRINVTREVAEQLE
ncbi:MAG: hypothetical protein QNJ65_21795, partial [Xenococcaceae cyanobacterium MO_234.B1]|nr:hypothetical protein [Xenococcaceae cyanobacterium MO_234.B1]